MRFFEKLMLSRQIKFDDGKAEILNQRVVFIPGGFLGEYTLEIMKKPESITLIYNSLKEGAGSFGKNIEKEYKNTLTDYSKLIKEVSDLAGWGITTFEFLNIEEGAIMSVENTPVGSYLKGRVDSPCDHIMRGMVAGIASIKFGKNLDVIEIECIAMGDKKCKFVIGELDKLKAKFPEVYKIQIKEGID